MRRSAYILLLAALFVGAAQGLNAIGFWKTAGLPEPRGYVAQGLIFLALLFVLQNLLFDPYLKVLEQREADTKGKRGRAEHTRAEAEKILERYREKITETRAKALREKELRALEAEEEERKLLKIAKDEASENMKKKLAEIRDEADSALRELHASVEPLAADIVRQTLKISPRGEQLRLLENTSET